MSTCEVDIPRNEVPRLPAAAAPVALPPPPDPRLLHLFRLSLRGGSLNPLLHLVRSHRGHGGEA